MTVVTLTRAEYDPGWTEEERSAQAAVCAAVSAKFDALFVAGGSAFEGYIPYDVHIVEGLGPPGSNGVQRFAGPWDESNNRVAPYGIETEHFATATVIAITARMMFRDFALWAKKQGRLEFSAPPHVAMSTDGSKEYPVRLVWIAYGRKAS